MSDQSTSTGEQVPLSALTTSSLGSAPKRIRHRETQIESAYELQRVSLPLHPPPSSRFFPR